MPSGVNGSKLRACQFLLREAKAAGKRRVISASSVLSPQSAMASSIAASLGMRCTVVLGGTYAESARKHRAVAIAETANAEFVYIKSGFNPNLQREASRLAAADADAYWLQYGITCPPDATTEQIRDFYSVGAQQVQNLPYGIKNLIIPFGSGNTAAGVLLGLSQHAPESLERIVLIGIGPDRQQWLSDRLSLLDVKSPVPVEHIGLHPGFCVYTDKMKASIGSVRLHETYEAKVACWAEQNRPDWWTARDNSTCLWVVGGPL